VIQEKLAQQFGHLEHGVDFVPAPDEYKDDERIIRRPRMRQRIGPDGQLIREDEERSTSFKELFYDLIFVVVIAHISHDHLRYSPSWTFPILFISVFRTWQDTTHCLNKFDTGDAIFKIAIVFQMGCVVGMVRARALLRSSPRKMRWTHLFCG
jgi:hypothetical protein